MERIRVDILKATIMNFKGDEIDEYDELVIRHSSYKYAPKKLDLDLANRPTPPANPSIEEPPVLELKELPGYLRYMFLGNGNTLPVIIVAYLGERQVTHLF